MDVYGVVIGIVFALCIFVWATSPSTPDYLKFKTDWWRPASNSTDDLINKKPSGLSIYTDHGTGCQYFSTAMGGLTPRLNKNGNPICGGKEAS